MCVKIKDKTDKLKCKQDKRMDCLNNFHHLSHIFIYWRSYGNDIIMVGVKSYCKRIN